jgi:alkylhydroperoxidase/carboxymuconolactone decarboxylase family protein YurZ
VTKGLPPHLDKLIQERPQLWEAYQALGKACAEAGPLDDRTRRLVKLALAIGARSEGAVHSHTRRGLAEGLSADELRHVAMLAVPTLGFPAAVAALTWIGDIEA